MPAPTASQAARRPAAPARHSGSARLLSGVAAASGAYDVGLALTLFFARPFLQQFFSLPAPAPPIHADLNALFCLAIGVGYVLPYRDPARYRGYLWVMGPFLKGTGSLGFLVDHYVRQSPPVFLVFALVDGALALVTLWALLRSRNT